MKIPLISISMLSLIFLSACSNVKEESMQKSNTSAAESVDLTRLQQLSIPAPVAKKIDHSSEYHGKALWDSYNWLKDQSYPDVNDQPIIDYLTQENAYFDAFLKPHKATSIPYLKNLKEGRMT